MRDPLQPRPVYINIYINSTTYTTIVYVEKLFEVIALLLEENDFHFVSIQEHFKICKTIDKYFSREFPKYSSYVVPAFRHKGQDSGRPKAGLAQLNKKTLGS